MIDWLVGSPGDQLIGVGESWHESTLFEPEDRSERSREEDSFDSSKSDEALCERRLRVRDPAHSPVGLLLDELKFEDGVEQHMTLGLVADVGLDKFRVHLRVNVLNGNLESVKEAGFRDFDFVGEAFAQVLVDNPVGSSKKGENSGDEVLLVAVHLLPVAHVLAKVDLFDGPERSDGFFVKLPDLMVLKREDHESIVQVLEQRLVGIQRVYHLLRRLLILLGLYRCLLRLLENLQLFQILLQFQFLWLLRLKEKGHTKYSENKSREISRSVCTHVNKHHYADGAQLNSPQRRNSPSRGSGSLLGSSCYSRKLLVLVEL